jgi:UDP-glucose 4-epimerase
MKKILIFGATGNTGAYLLDYYLKNLTKSEFEVIAIGRKDTDYFEKNQISYIKMDISQEADFDKLPKENVYAVIHTAAKLPTHASINDPQGFISVNITGTLNLLEYCRKTNVDRVIFTQTMSNIANVLGKVPIIKPDVPRNFPLKGDHVMYVVSKNTAEDIVEHYHLQYGIKIFIFKIPTIYQYRENRFWYVNGEKRFRTFHRFIDMAIAGEPIEMWGDPSSYKDLVYVKDYCQMLFKATFVDGINRGVYNVGTGVPVRLDTMLNEIVNIFSEKNNRSSIIARPEKPNTNSYIIDVSNAKEDLGYEVKFGLKEMLTDIKEEMKKNRFISLRTNG